MADEGTDATAEDIQYLLACCTEKLEAAEHSLERVVDMEARVCDKGNDVQAEIRRTADSMIDTIQMRKLEMTGQVRSAMKAKQKALGGQRDKLERFMESLRSAVQYSEDVLNNNGSADVKEWQSALLKVLREMTEKTVEYEPAANDNFELTVNEEEHMFDLHEFFTRLCTRKRSHLTSNGQLRC